MIAITDDRADPSIVDSTGGDGGAFAIGTHLTANGAAQLRSQSFSDIHLQEQPVSGSIAFGMADSYASRTGDGAPQYR